MKTVRELADELGVSPQAVRDEIKRQCKADAKHFAKHFAENGGKFLLDETAENLVKTSFLKRQGKEDCKDSAKHFAKHFAGNFAEISEVFAKELDAKNAQIEAQAKLIESLTETIRTQAEQIGSLTDSLKAAQALHAGTMQERLEQKAPAEDPEVVSSQDAQKTARHWWQFWK